MTPTPLFLYAVLTLTGAAAITDARSGHIPNWLTLPPIALAPMIHGVRGGFFALGLSLVAVLICGLVPYLMFRKGAAGGGDVKLLTAIGALVGVSVGLEAQLLGFAAAVAYALLRLTWHGYLFRTIGNVLWAGGQFVSAAPLPKRADPGGDGLGAPGYSDFRRNLVCPLVAGNRWRGSVNPWRNQMPRCSAERGTVMIEFVIVFLPLFLLMLCILQLALLYATSLGVRHAATIGARSAIVVLPDDQARYDGEPLNTLGTQQSCRQGALSKLLGSLNKLGLSDGALASGDSCVHGAREAAIRRAVLMAMLPFGPKLSDIVGRRLSGSSRRW